MRPGAERGLYRLRAARAGDRMTSVITCISDAPADRPGPIRLIGRGNQRVLADGSAPQPRTCRRVGRHVHITRSHFPRVLERVTRTSGVTYGVVPGRQRRRCIGGGRFLAGDRTVRRSDRIPYRCDGVSGFVAFSTRFADPSRTPRPAAALAAHSPRRGIRLPRRSADHVSSLVRESAPR